MKLLLTLGLILSVHTAQADSFTIIRDGKEYLCEQRGPLNPIDGLECANKAYSGPFSREESQALCAGARSTAPADCAIKAYAGRWSRAEALRLCTKSRTASGPVDCADKAYSGPFSNTEALTLCEANGSVLNADCAIKAYAGPYSREEAVRMCKEQPMLVLRSLQLLEQAVQKSVEMKNAVQGIKQKLEEK